MAEEKYDNMVDYGPPVEVLSEGPITAAVKGHLPGQLKRYWLGPEGSARVGGWGNPGSFRACQRELRKEGVPSRMINGECANLHKAATGHWPGEKKEEHALAAAFWNKKKHPRDKDGKFTDVPGGGGVDFPYYDEDDDYSPSTSNRLSVADLLGVKQSSLKAARGSTSFGPEMQASAEDYQNGGDVHINMPLREDIGGEPYTDRAKQTLADLDSMMKQSPLTEEAVVLRGVANPQKMFGDAWKQGSDNTGLTWTDDAFVSTTTDEDTAAHFATERHDGGAIVFRVKAPAGTPALHLESGRYGSQKELLLDRGLTFRITRDNQNVMMTTEENPLGSMVRVLDVEVVR